MRKTSKEEWAAVEAMGTTKRTRVYNSNTCPLCGRLIREGAYSGRDGNFKKHMGTHNQKETRT